MDESGKPSFEERMQALTMNLELTVHAVERLNVTMAAIGATVIAHDGQIGQLLALAQAQNERITRLEGNSTT